MPVNSFDSVAATTANISNAQTTLFHGVSHSDPTDSIYQGSTKRYTPSAQAYTIQNFTSGGSTLGSGSNRVWEFARVADLGGQTFALIGLVGLANCVELTDASSVSAVCEIVHPDIIEHYRLALGTTAKGRVISERDTSFEFYATDGTSSTDASANFVHFYEGQPYWTPNVGYHCQNSATELIGSAVVDVQHGMRQAAWAEVNAQPGKRLGAMVGGSDLGSIRHNKHLELKRRSMRFQLLCVPLLASYCLDPAGYLPLPAMQFHKVELSYSFRDVSKLICNGSRFQSGAGGQNTARGTSIVRARLDGLSSATAALALPFQPSDALGAIAANVYTVTRYAEDSSNNVANNKGAMVALVDNASWLGSGAESDLSGSSWAVTNASCEVMVGARMAFLQGAERASMIQGGYDIPILASQLASSNVTPGSAGSSTTLSVDINAFVNSIEALYVVTGSSNALGANHYNAGRTWDPIVEEYTSMANHATVTINGNPAFQNCHPAFYNKMLAYINGTCVPTGDSHIMFVPFAMQVNSTDGSVEVTGSASAASRWSTASVSLALPNQFTQAANTVFAGATSGKTQHALVYGDTYNSLHVGQGVGGNVLSGTTVATNPPF